MSFFSTTMAFAVLTTVPVLIGPLAGEAQHAPAQPAAPSAQPPSPPSATQPAAPDPSTLPPAPGERPQPAPADMGQRQRVEGVVQSVSGSTMMLKSSAGPVITVDLSRVSTRVHEIVPKGESVTVIGIIPPGSDRLIAQAVIGNLKPDAEAPAALPRAR